MKRVLMLVLLPVLASGLALAGASGASAATLVHVSGTDLDPTPGRRPVTRSTTAGTLLTCTTPDFATRYTGDLTGTISTDFTWVDQLQLQRIDGSRRRDLHRLGRRRRLWHAHLGDEVPRDLRLQHPDPVEPGRLRDHHVRHRQADRTPRQAQVSRADLLRHPDPLSPNP